MAVNNSLQPKQSTFSSFITADAVKAKINSTIGGKDGQRFISAILSAVSVNPALQECEHSTILSAALLGESLRLSPSPQLGQYYLVPFNDRERGKVATFILGYKGYIQLAIRSGYYKKINVLAIKEGELVKFDPLTEEIEVNLISDYEKREQAKTTGYYAMFEYVSGFRKIMYWSKPEMEIHAIKYSKGYQAKKGYTFWEKDFDGMAYKTMLRQLISKWGIMSIEMQTALESDIDFKEAYDNYVENAPDATNKQIVEPEIKEEHLSDEEKAAAAKRFEEGVAAQKAENEKQAQLESDDPFGLNKA